MIDADSVGLAEQRHELRLEIGGESWIRLSRHLDGIQPARTADVQRAVLFLNAHADLFEAVRDGNQMIGVAVAEFEFAVGHGGGDHERAALDAIGNDPMFRAD